MKERRVINIPKDSYDFIKSYCKSQALSMPLWIIKTCVEKIVNEKPEILDSLPPVSLEELLTELKKDKENK